MTRRRAAILGAGALAAFLVASELDFRAELADQAHYCRMVEIYNESDGRHGWPDFRDLGDKCNDD